MAALFAATRRTNELVGREREMTELHEAIYTGDDSCRIVFIQGHGGYGKTRLLEETLWRLGNPSERNDYPMTDAHRAKGMDWQDFDRVVATDIIDLIDTRLHARNHFLREAREKLRWAQVVAPEFNFNTYDPTLSKYERRMLDNVEYRLTQEAAAEAIEAFWKDYGQLVRGRRIVWAIDTAEQLNIIASQWLIDAGLLAEEQLQFQAQKWLAAAIRERLFQNTTLLLAGRDREGAAFFKAIQEAAKEAGAVVHTLEAKPFTEAEVQKYFAILKEDWKQRVASALTSPDAVDSENRLEPGLIAQAMESLFNNPQRLRALHAYTDGQPVRLALFADLITESRAFPDALKVPDVEALPEGEKELKQWELEEEVVGLLFRQPRVAVSGLPPTEARARIKQATLRRDILLALARARMGLSAEQLHYVIDNTTDDEPEVWREKSSSERLRQIAATMEELRELSIVKGRPRRIAANGNGQEEGALRLGLQDEAYRIFAEHMAPHVALGKPVDEADEEERERLKRILAALSQSNPQALARYEQNHRAETTDRTRLYKLLQDWAEWERKSFRRKLKEIQESQEERMELELYRVTPAAPRSARLPFTGEEQQRQEVYRRALRELDLEYMHYAFSLNPDRELNESYFDLADEFWRANDEDADILTQAEMWRILRDRHALKFVEWGKPREAVKERGEETIDVLRRAAIQEDASRWIKRLALRRRYEEAVKFADRIENYIDTLSDENDKRSWQHTFARSERLCWREFARILPAQGRELLSAVESLARLTGPLEQLTQHDTATLVFLEPREWGFKGHPAHIRLKRVISVIFANMGYGYTQLGRFRDAVNCYSKALNYIRETGANAHRATVLNNLSRALSEMGRQRALRICLDALEFRRELGADAPIGFSHSTLALILNDQNNPDRAWIEAAKAALYFQRVDDPRGKGLASIQLAEALRRLVTQSRYGRALPASPDEIYRAAEEAINEALDVFLKTSPTLEEKAQGKVREPLRWIEAQHEKGCLYRDRLTRVKKDERPREWQNLRSTALGLLTEAADEARESGWPRLELDARVNIAWTHYYAGDLDEAEKTIDRAKDLIGEIIGRDADIIGSDKPLPTLAEAGIEAYIYYQLSKLHGLRGRIALDRFRTWGKTFEYGLEEKQRDITRPEKHARIEVELGKAPHYLDQAADAYLLGITYAQLFSPRSTALPALYDALYDYLKRFNEVELAAFHRHIRAHFLTSLRDKIRFTDLGNLENFLHESVGFAVEGETA